MERTKQDNIWCNTVVSKCYSDDSEDSQKCNFEKKCLPQFMPKQEGIPQCTSQLEALCSNAVLNDLREGQAQHCKKPCLVREYIVKDETNLHSDCQYDAQASGNANVFSISYDFGSPDTSKELRTDRPFKTVHKEYYLLDEWGLIGNVGGTLGLFTGFSFFGFLIC